MFCQLSINQLWKKMLCLIFPFNLSLVCQEKINKHRKCLLKVLVQIEVEGNGPESADIVSKPD